MLNPTFAANSEEVAFVQRLSGRDSAGERPDDIYKNANKSYLSKQSLAQRKNDPVVSIFDYQKEKLSLIDFGWAPAFSQNDGRLAYAHQLKPLQEQDRLYADAYRGNSIKVYNKSTQKTEEVARPQGLYLLDPLFIDSLTLAYKTGEKVNGPFGSAISLSQVNLRTKKTVLMQQAAIKYRLYNLIGEIFMKGKQPAYVVYSPADTGQGMANEYVHLLVSGSDTLQNFGIRRFTNLSYKFAINERNEILFLDDQHYLPEDTNYLAVYAKGALIQNQPLSFKYQTAYLSPGGKNMVYITATNEAYLVNLKNFAQTKIERPQKEVHTIAWSNDGKRLGLVQDHEKLGGTDELLLYEIR
ncbi:hypothetical protein ABDK00_016715 [Niabella insulamsoli]|uniref:hypothetical protein n=1 Tax=Niabella insulamsoli TaxID=3144874 RepID=UPI0031FE138C